MPVKKVLHVIPSVGPLRGGPSFIVRTLASGLARSGIETHVATTDDNGPGQLRVRYEQPIVEGGVTYWYFRRQARFYTFSWPLHAWLACHTREFDLIHIHALFSFAVVPAALYANVCRVPYVVTPLGILNQWGMKNRRPRMKSLSFRLLESRILKHAAVVHYGSEQEVIEARKLHIGAPSAVIPYPLADYPGPIETGHFRSHHPEFQGRKIVLFLSRVDAKKGVDLLLPAFAKVRHEIRDAVLVIAGDGDREFVSQMKAKAKMHGIDSDVYWTGFLSGEEKWSALADANVFVLPSYSDNFGIAVIEAMAAGTPVVVSDQVGLHREIVQANAGLVTSTDVESLSDALVQLLANPSGSLLMGLRGREIATRAYSSDAIARKLISVYNQIVNQPR